MNVDAVHRFNLWCESTERDVVPVRMDGAMPPVETHPYALVRFPLYVETRIYRRRAEDGGYSDSDRIAVSGASANASIVTAIVQAGVYPLGDALIIVSEACARCLNVLAHTHGLPFGYPEGSEEWQRSNTECAMCADVRTVKNLTVP